MVVNTHYKENLKAAMQVAKKYTDDKIEQALELLEDYELSSETISQTSRTATAPSDVRTSSLIEVGGNCVKYAPSEASNKNVAYKKSIPNNTYKLFVDKDGGMSYKTTNLFDKSQYQTPNNLYVDANTNKVSTAGVGQSVVIPINSNTTYFFRKTITSRFRVGLSASTEVGASAREVYNDASSYYCTFTTSSTEKYLFVLLRNNVENTLTYSQIIDTVMLSFGSSVLPYEEYFDGIRNTAVSQLTIRGVNLASDVTNRNISTAYFVSLYIKAELKPNTTYTISFVGTNGNRLYCNENLFNYVSLVCDGTRQSLTLTTKAEISTLNDQQYDSTYGWQIFKNQANNDVVSNFANVMLNLGSTAPSEYKPYVTPIIKTIPSEIQALTGWGWGLTQSASNYLYYPNKKYVQAVNRVKAKDLTWVYNTQYQFFYAYVDGNRNAYDVGTLPNVLCALYTTVNVGYDSTMATNPDFCITNTRNSTVVQIKDTNYTDATLFKNHFTDDDYIYFELATPIETDVSQYLTDFNPIETNDLYGEIEFVNTYNQDMPNEISFVGTIKETLVTSFTIGNETTNITDSIESDGWSVSNSIYNYRKTRDKERHKIVGRVDLGSPTYFYDSANNRFTTTINNIKNVLQTEVPNAMCCCYDILAFNTIIANPTRDLVIGFNTSGVMTIKNFAYTDETNFKNAMSGIYLYYELATPEVTPLDVDTDFHYIDLESGETITFNNANNQACHNTIRYSIMEEKV